MTPLDVDAIATEEGTTESWSTLGGVLLSALYLWVLVWLVLAVALPTIGLGWQPAIITSGSMEPLIRPGDVVLTVPAHDVEPGQVITYEDPAREGTLTTHRVVGITDDGLLRTRGDANVRSDSDPVPPENVVGRGRLLVPLIGLPIHWLSSGLLLFGLWAIVTAISVVVIGGGGGGPPQGGSRRRPTGRRLAGLRGRLEPLRPHAVQRAVIQQLVRAARAIHDRTYRGWRPEPSRIRRGLPSVVVVVAALVLAETAAAWTIAGIGLVLVLLLDPDGPHLRIGRYEQLARHGLRAIAGVRPAPGLARGVLVLVLVASSTGQMMSRSMAAFGAGDDNLGNYFTAAASFPADLTLWLQDEPEDTHTNDATYSPMSADEPTQTVLYNYDANDDADPGLRIQKGALDPYDTNDKKVQRWTHTPSSDLTVASATLTFHSAVKDYRQGEPATVTWYLRHCDATGGDCVEMASATVSDADWSGGSTGFLERTTTFGTVAHVVPAGRQLELTLTDPTSQSDLWFAYDTVDHPSRLEIDAATPGLCPGAGTAVRHVTADTRVEENRPTDNFSTNAELDATSNLGDNHRSLLTVTLPTIPSGCTLTSARLLLTTRTSSTGRTIAVQRLDAPFDPTTVTWSTQPTASGAIGTGPSTINGSTPLDATGPVGELYTLGNTGLQVRDSVEDAATNETNRFHSTESRAYPNSEGPQLEVTWGP